MQIQTNKGCARVCSIFLTAFLIWFSSASAATSPLTVFINFENSGLSAVDQEAIFKNVKDCYTGIPGADKIVFTMTRPNVIDINRTAIVDLSRGIFGTGNTPLWGKSSKKTSGATVYVGEYANSDFTEEEKRNGIGDTVAHELGHLLCATHEDDAGVNKPASEKMRGGPTDDEKKLPGRRFGDDTKRQIARGLDAYDRLDGLKWRFGDEPESAQSCMEWVTGKPTDPSITLEDLNFDASLQLSSSDLEFGWINFEGDFFSYVPKGETEAVIEFEDSDRPNFAIRLGTGEILDMDSPAFLGFSLHGTEWNSDQAFTPHGNYFSEATLSWATLEGDVSASFQADLTFGSNGFMRCPDSGSTLILLAGGFVGLLRLKRLRD
ncbi:MAG: VPDSG-CTERM sorting domain-containing protein [Verrucomicrobiales bacterium]